MPLYKTCRRCRRPDLTTTWRESQLTTLCAECNSDMDRIARVLASKLYAVLTEPALEPEMVTYSPMARAEAER